MMRTYDSYKDSGIEWIGETPRHWSSSKLKFVLERIVTGGTPDTSNDSYWSDNEDGYSWISISDMTSNPSGIESTKKKITQRGLDSKRLELLLIDTLIYSIYGSIGKVNKLKIESTIHQGILGLIPDSKIQNRYLEFYLKYIQDFVNILCSSNTQENLNLDKVRNIGIVIPPLTEQEQIVSFLDEKTSLIDEMVEKKKRKIELLKEFRTSLINTVVTKGLNPDVPMKDSGIEWIGEIPSHWVVGKLGFYTSKIGSGLTPKGGSEIYSESGIPFIRSQNVHFQGLVLDNVSYIDIDIHNSMSGSKVSYNDVLLNITGGSIGRCCVVQVNQEMNVNQHVCIIRTNNKLSPYYLNYLLSSTIGQSQVTYNISGGNREGLTVDGIKDIIIDLPPFSEQEQIVSYLDEKTGEIDKTIELENKKIELLKEYRQSLISNVVTGKIKVVSE